MKLTAATQTWNSQRTRQSRRSARMIAQKLSRSSFPLISEWSASPESCWSGKWKKENKRPDKQLKLASSLCTRQVLYTGSGRNLCGKTLSFKTIPLFHPDRYTKSPLSRQMMERVITPCLLFNGTFYHRDVLLSEGRGGLYIIPASAKPWW